MINLYSKILEYKTIKSKTTASHQKLKDNKDDKYIIVLRAPSLDQLVRT